MPLRQEPERKMKLITQMLWQLALAVTTCIFDEMLPRSQRQAQTSPHNSDTYTTANHNQLPNELIHKSPLWWPKPWGSRGSHPDTGIAIQTQYSTFIRVPFLEKNYYQRSVWALSLFLSQAINNIQEQTVKKRLKVTFVLRQLPNNQ